MNKNALIIMAKAPDPENVKTRLATDLSDEERLKLYTRLLKDTIWKLRAIPEVDTFINYAPKEGEGYFSRIGLEIFPQSKGDLGERMYDAIKHVLDMEYGKAVLVGVDIPDLSDSIIEDAFHMLSINDVVFGPARDGGYYLVGLNEPIKELFVDIEWSTANTLKQTLKVAEALGLTVSFTDMLSDLDTIDDFKKVESRYKDVIS